MKKVEKQIKNQVNTLLPDEKVRENVLRNAKRGGTCVQEKLPFWTGKRIAILSVACSLIICLAVGAFGVYLFLGGANSAGMGYLNNPNSKNAFALSLGSAFQLVGSVEASSGLQAVADKTEQNLVVEQIEKNIALVEGFINESSCVYVEETSDRTEYSYKAKLTMNGETLTIYYNIVGQKDAENNVGVVDDDIEDDKDDADDDFDFDNEKEYGIRGVALSGEKEYLIYGEKEMEEGESELEMYIVLDEISVSVEDWNDCDNVENYSKNYIHIEQEIEDEEQEFNYTIVKNGQKIDKFSIEAEKRANGEFYHYKKGIGKDMTHIKYHKVENKNKSMLKIDYKQGNKQYKVELTTKIDTKSNEVIKEYKIQGNKIIVKEPIVVAE